MPRHQNNQARDQWVQMTAGPHVGKVGRIMREVHSATVPAFEVRLLMSEFQIVTVPSHMRHVAGKQDTAVKIA